MSFFACFCNLILKNLPVQMGIVSTMVCGCYSLDYFSNQTPIFDRCVVQRGSENEHHKDTCLKEIGLRCQILLTTPHSTLSMPVVWRIAYVFSQEINKHALHITITNSREVQLSIQLLVMPHCTSADVTQLPLCMYM